MSPPVWLHHPVRTGVSASERSAGTTVSTKLRLQSPARRDPTRRYRFLLALACSSNRPPESVDEARPLPIRRERSRFPLAFRGRADRNGSTGACLVGGVVECSNMTTRQAPLHGVRIVESSMLGPGAITTHLADLGADVIKVEPPQGDYVREMTWPIVEGV